MRRSFNRLLATAVFIAALLTGTTVQANDPDHLFHPVDQGEFVGPKLTRFAFLCDITWQSGESVVRKGQITFALFDTALSVGGRAVIGMGGIGMYRRARLKKQTYQQILITEMKKEKDQTRFTYLHNHRKRLVAGMNIEKAATNNYGVVRRGEVFIDNEKPENSWIRHAPDTVFRRDKRRKTAVELIKVPAKCHAIKSEKITWPFRTTDREQVGMFRKPWFTENPLVNWHSESKPANKKN